MTLSARGSTVLALAGLAVAWEIVGRLSISFFVPPLSAVGGTWLRLVLDGTIPWAVATSVLELARGFVLAATLGVVLGVLMGASKVVRDALGPFVNVGMSAPLSALVPVFIAIFGMRPTVVAATVFMFSFFVIVVNTATGVRGTEASLIEMARSFGARPAVVLWTIYLPRALPATMLGLRLGAVQAVKGMVVGEMLISVVGLGERLIYYGNSFLIPQLYAVILSVLFLALMSAQLVDVLDRSLIRWK